MDPLLKDIRFHYAVLKAALLTLEQRADRLPRRTSVGMRMALTRHWVTLDQERGSAVSHDQAQTWIAAFAARIGLGEAITAEEGLLRYVMHSVGHEDFPTLADAASLIEEDDLIAAET